MAHDAKFWQSAAVSVSKRRNSPRRAVEWAIGKRVLVTGAAGFLDSYLRERLLHRGRDIL